MTAVRRWSGHEARALRIALRFSVRAFAEHLGVAARTVSKWEAGGSTTHPRPDTQAMLDTVLARADGSALRRFEMSCTHAVSPCGTGDEIDVSSVSVVDDTGDVDRRELLRLLSVAGATLALPGTDRSADADRLVASSDKAYAPDSAAVEGYARLNAHLWQVFGLAVSKQTVFPLVREHLATLTSGLARAPVRIRPTICALVADLYQLSGEIFFDANMYTDASHCYSLAAAAGRESSAFDLWASALTRQAFIAVSDRSHASALALLDLAERIARRGDSTLSTRHWVSAVRAEIHAALADHHTCARNLDQANHVIGLGPEAHNGGWLRFDGSRLPETRGACLVALGRFGDAEDTLTDALPLTTTPRRRAVVLIDLAVVGAYRRDSDHVVDRLTAALTTARTTTSGVVDNKLRMAIPALTPLLHERRVRDLHNEITARINQKRRIP